MPVKNLIPRTKITALSNRLRRSGQRIVFTNGVFDILHRGHVEYLSKARSFGDVLILGLNSDASVRRIKGPTRPLQKQTDRAVILLALESVDYVVIFGEDTPDKLIGQIKPDVLVKGADYKISEIVGADFVRSYGGRVRRVRLTRGRSTSGLVKRVVR
ncbi:MAG: D-glycero-beta-D-manno-heptose 1-phosphate adenylyltransferase [candidate division Zixibacteria bacterium]|nr:D-glycero-beta-D-manno-heptose 1-phosphate adenylyltransferase [candidate division Zixibacteria bacterium]MDH3937712.1 D-glycero-beta-D-manno-heptose 1-phosphate adenylyltransferase [candidate division Zixibacteria bacterium]MDH4034506.1 D-glycero-beta-D-manno-heptose 1-phosphate adenylyltransferase [candidate division Zixibacteria bacterium]